MPDPVIAWPDGYGRLIVPEVGSTLDEALRLAQREPAPFWLLAQHQTAGRGRRGRAWAMAEGNFAATLVLRPQEPPPVQALRSFVVSLALYRAFVDATGAAQAFALKWPNDVLLNGGKVAGILLENAGRADILAIGVGINLAAAPPPASLEEGALRPVSVVGETAVRIGPEAFLDILAHHYAVLECQFREMGFAAIRSGWLAHAARLGEVIRARTGREDLTGIFEDVDADGHLVLRGPNGARSIPAADVFF